MTTTAPNDSQVEFKVNADGQAFMRVKDTGTVMLYFAHKPAEVPSGDAVPGLRDGTGRLYAWGFAEINGELMLVAWPYASPRLNRETYRARGTAKRPSDRITSFDRWISGRLYHITRVWDGATGITDVTLFKGSSTQILKRFVYDA